MSRSHIDIIRPLAGRLRELAEQPEMRERTRLWAALKDLHAERPMLLFETAWLEQYVGPDELQCESPLFRSVEEQMLGMIRHAEEVGDDYVVPPVWRILWDISSSDYGVEISYTHSTDSTGGGIGFSCAHPIHTPNDLDRLQPRVHRVDREGALRRYEVLSEAFGDLLPVELQGTGGLHAGLTRDAFKLIGNENLLTWPYDAPEALHRLLAYLRDDRLTYFRWLEREGLLGLNNRELPIGSGSPGLTTALPQADHAGTVRLRDLWGHMEAQETAMISPEIFAEFFLPYMAEVAQRFGLVYYGCCEPVHDRWICIRQAIPQVRAVSVSPWCDMTRIAEQLGRDVVFSRKLQAAPMSGEHPDWETLQRDVQDTLDAAQGCNLELIFRDVYRIHGDRPRLRQWSDMVRERIER